MPFSIPSFLPTRFSASKTGSFFPCWSLRWDLRILREAVKTKARGRYSPETTQRRYWLRRSFFTIIPQIAPESAGNLFDGTEIDEILSLRILTLTDAEKTEIRQSDDRARELLDRTEKIPDEQFMKLHGVLRGLTVLKEKPE